MVKIIGDFALIEVIGQGQYGKVYKAVHMETKVEVAVKAISISKFQQISKLTEGMRNQVQTLTLLQGNPNIVKFQEMIKTPRSIYMVYEFCQGGTLDSYIRKYGHLQEAQALLLMRQLMNAFRAMSDHCISHRDIKPDNILFKNNELKLADFGFCKKMGTLDDLTQTVLGSPVYMAPEVLNGDLYNSKADIWSLGVVFYEMLFGTAPFGQGSLSDLIRHTNSFELTLPSHNRISAETEGLLRRMLTKEHFRRISWEDLFFEYDIDSKGALSKKQRGFQYDLMKLMKKNSSRQSPPEVSRRPVKININWDSLIDRKSSVCSQELESYYHGCDIDKLVSTKKQIKHLFLTHSKCHQSSSVLMDVIGRRYCQNSGTIGYIIATNIKASFERLQVRICDFKSTHSSFLETNPTDADKLRKLQLLLVEEKNTLLPRVNKLRLTLLVQSKHQIAKASDNPLMKRHAKEYLQRLKQRHPGYDTFQQSQLNKDIAVHVIKVLSALSLAEQKETIRVDESMPKPKLSKILHKKKRDLDL